jgi:membrane-associated protein
MQILKGLLDFVLHLDKHLSPIIHEYGAWTYLLLFLIVFCETGLVVTPFLPGDSLLFAAGAFAANGSLSVWALAGSLIAAAILGDTANYWIGHFLGHRLLNARRRIIKPEHIAYTHEFFEKYGGKTIIIARFVPIVRTFAPIVAGASQMPYRQFVVFNLVGGFLWVFTMILAGFFLGRAFPALREHIEIVMIVIVALSLMPPVIEYIKSRREKARAAQTGDAKV